MLAPAFSRATALAAALVCLGVVACGGDEDSVTSTGAKAVQGSEGGSRDQGGVDGPTGSGNAGPASDRRPREDTSAGFTPRDHYDSGGGSGRLRIPGGDNSVQEYGSEVEGTEFEQAAEALHGFHDARAQRAWRAACSYLSDRAVASLEEVAALVERSAGASCADGLELSTKPTALKLLRSEARQINVGSLRAEGERGFLLYRGTEGAIFAISTEREDGEWKLGSISALPLS